MNTKGNKPLGVTTYHLYVVCTMELVLWLSLSHTNGVTKFCNGCSNAVSGVVARMWFVVCQ